ncbi:MAG: hypothetical protein FWF08_03830 [Oscillospiraceae bacterium]|nr:hypothetical protein [Oscillospiraceae bacterium]
MGTKNDYDAAYIPIEAILKNEILNTEQKLEMIEFIVENVLHGKNEQPQKAETAGYRVKGTP